jgi:EmrB/QacA subfamily drug resistance transporter
MSTTVGSPIRGSEGISADRRRQRLVLVVTCVALATVVSAVASLNVAIPSIARDTHASQTELSWVVDAYALVFAALLLPAGALGDRWGRRKALVVGLVVFAAAAASAMTRADAQWLIAMRAVLGIGAALVMPATLSTITSTFPAAERAKAVGTWAGVAGASAILGLLTSGLLLEVWSWRSVFGLNVVLAVVAIVGTLRVVPESADPDAAHLDGVGALISFVGLGALVYSIIEAPTNGWWSARTLTGLVLGLVVLVGFVLWELGRREPLIDPRLFRYRGFAAGTLSILLQFFAFFGFIFLVLQYLQLVLGDSPLVAALSLVPMAAGMMPSARILAPRLVARVGAGPTSGLGLLVAALALLWLSRLGVDSSYWPLLVGLVPLGAGMGLAMTPATAAITDALPREKQGVGSAVNDLARELGGALGIAVLGSVLQSVYRGNLDVGALPGPAAEQVRASLASALRLGPEVAHSAQLAFMDGTRAAFLLGCGVLVAAAVAVVLLHPRITPTRVGSPARQADRRDAAEESGRAPEASAPASERPAT